MHLAAVHESGFRTSLPIIDVRFGGEFRRESGLVLLTMSLSILTPLADMSDSPFGVVQNRFLALDNVLD
jgi:hypothetical protein